MIEAGAIKRRIDNSIVKKRAVAVIPAVIKPSSQIFSLGFFLLIEQISQTTEVDSLFRINAENISFIIFYLEFYIDMNKSKLFSQFHEECL